MQRTLLITVLAASSLAPVSMFAQRGGAHRNQDPHKQAAHISNRLGLSGDQTARLEPLLQQRHDQTVAIDNNTSLSADQRQTQLRDVNRGFRQQVSGLLTTEQKEQWKSMRKHRRTDQEAERTPRT